MSIPAEVKDRIFAAADKLHAEGESGSFPTVEAVRKESRASMNYVVEGMKEWRQAQRQQVQEVREPLPIELQAVLQSAGQSMWDSAQALANQSLQAAQAAFDAEKAEQTAITSELMQSFELQAAELEEAHRQNDELKDAATRQAATMAELRDVLEAGKEALSESRQAAALALQRGEQLSASLDEAKREALGLAETIQAMRNEAEKLRTERDRAQHHAELLKTEKEAAQAAAAELQKQLQQSQSQAALEAEKSKIAAAAAAATAADLKQHQERTAASAEDFAKQLAAAHAEAGKARESAAQLAGQLEATNAQNAQLMAVLKAQATTEKPTKK